MNFLRVLFDCGFVISFVFASFLGSRMCSYSGMNGTIGRYFGMSGGTFCIAMHKLVGLSFFGCYIDFFRLRLFLSTVFHFEKLCFYYYKYTKSFRKII